MKLRVIITMECDNDAFGRKPSREALRILNDGTLDYVVETACDTCSTEPEVDAHIGRILKDKNGNTVGRVDAEVIN